MAIDGLWKQQQYNEKKADEADNGMLLGSCGQVDEDVTELENEEQVDSALLGEESCKQVDDEDALYFFIADTEVAKSAMTASYVTQLQPQPQVVRQLQTEMLPLPLGLPTPQVIQASTMNASQYLSSVESQPQLEEISIAQDEQNVYEEAHISQYMDAESGKKENKDQTAGTPNHTVVETPQELNVV
uniref:Uncharacterized protein n=1 Tax=Romanomermis culicivorax TaxID=13658 RepID=A0A915JTU4_ROMCU